MWKEYHSDLLTKPIKEPPQDLTDNASSMTIKINAFIDCQEPTEPVVCRAICRAIA